MKINKQAALKFMLEIGKAIVIANSNGDETIDLIESAKSIDDDARDKLVQAIADALSNS